MSTDSRQTRIHASPQWRDGKFRNRLDRIDGKWTRMIRELLFGGSPHRKPTSPIPVERRSAADYDAPPASGLRVTWLGHSCTLVEIDGRRVLVDPMYGERAGPLSFAGPRRFYDAPLAVAELPALDAVLVSHDHYDHLHEGTVRALAERGERFVAPLGVGERLTRWGVREDRVAELDWWESLSLGTLTVTAAPARHFSGRKLVDNDRTLWCGFAIAGPRRRVFYSGDTALHDDFPAIAERLGPFDLTMIEVGAYSHLWPDVHAGPEQAVRAHALLGGLSAGAAMLPLHWGTFDLALHGWTEPVERALVAAQSAGARLLTPRPGELVEPDTFRSARWWPDVPWQTEAEAPVQSTGVEHLMR